MAEELLCSTAERLTSTSWGTSTPASAEVDQQRIVPSASAISAPRRIASSAASGKSWAGHRVVEGADLGAPAHLGEREREQRPAVAQRLVLEAHGERQEVALRRRATLELDLDLGQEITLAAVARARPTRPPGRR